MADKDFQKFASEQLGAIYAVEDYERVLRALQEADPAFKKVTPAQFGPEFLGMRLALACHAWARACRENKADGGAAVENLLFKTVMQSFQSPKFVDIAAVFSEYLHAPESDDKPLLPAAGLMMRRLGLTAELGSLQNPKLSPGFRMLVEIAESLKSIFENEFFDFYFAS
jgi:hypothetical protein